MKKIFVFILSAIIVSTLLSASLVDHSLSPLTLAAVNTAIVAACLTAHFVTDFYLNNLKGIPDILKALGYKSLDTQYISYDSFNTGRLQYGYFIITFFNKVPNFNDPSTFAAHTVFVKRDFKNQTGLTSYNKYQTRTEFYSLYTTNANNRNSQFISGITIKG